MKQPAKRKRTRNPPGTGRKRAKPTPKDPSVGSAGKEGSSKTSTPKKRQRAPAKKFTPGLSIVSSIGQSPASTPSAGPSPAMSPAPDRFLAGDE